MVVVRWNPGQQAEPAATEPKAPAAAKPAKAVLTPEQSGTMPKRPERTASRRTRRVTRSKRIRSRELPPFSRQLSAMLLAGMPLIQTLDALEDQSSDQSFRAVINGLRGSLQAGESFSEALSHYPSVFDRLYVNMIRAGESGGQLGETAGRLASFLESAAKLTRKVKSAMTYPVVVMLIALAIATGMILFIVPVFAEMFGEFGADLPGPTQFLINVSHFLKRFGLLLAGAIIAALFILRRWARTEAGGYQFASLALRLPVVGELNRKVATSRFARTFAQLLSSGVPILQAMDIVAGATGNKVFEHAVRAARVSVEMGEPVANILTNYKCFPKLLTHMMAAGEKTGKIDEMMESIADFYDDEVEAMLNGLTSLIEPMLMIFLGVVIGGIVVAMFLPIFKMGEVVGM